jgi:hypothetical protein
MLIFKISLCNRSPYPCSNSLNLPPCVPIWINNILGYYIIDILLLLITNHLHWQLFSWSLLYDLLLSMLDSESEINDSILFYTNKTHVYFPAGGGELPPSPNTLSHAVMIFYTQLCKSSWTTCKVTGMHTGLVWIKIWLNPVDNYCLQVSVCTPDNSKNQRWKALSNYSSFLLGSLWTSNLEQTLTTSSD